jgi:archaeosine synthase
MTKYFEVLRRDGPARLGKLTLEQSLKTPAALSDEDYISVGSIFGFSSEEKALATAVMEIQKKLVIMPHAPSGLRSEPSKIASSDEVKIGGPKGIVVHPFASEVEKADVYVISSAGCLRSPRDLVRAVLGLRNIIPPDSAIYAPALATPENLALLVYLGIDLVDATRVIADGYYGRYHTRDRVFDSKSPEELPCRCESCVKWADNPSPELLASHNVQELEMELRRIKEAIRSEVMREYVERQVRVKPELTAAFRVLDQEHSYLERRTPQHRKSVMYANTTESLSRVEVTRFAERALTRFTPPKADVLLLLPCSARKPYSTSRSHRRFIEAIGPWRRYLNELILTSPLALVPRELEEVYPAANYDVPVTGRWDCEERRWLLKCLDAYLEKNRYSSIVAHIDGELREAVEDHGIDAIYTGGGTGDEGLARLSQAVKETTRGAVRTPDPRLQRFMAVADYYLGKGTGYLLFSGKVKIKGMEVQDERRRALARITPQGMIALSLEGAKILEPRGTYTVAIGDFLPKGSLLAPGVVDADEQIRPGDEVIIRGEKAFGIGRAKMSGWEMATSSRGVAVELKQIEEIG